MSDIGKTINIPGPKLTWRGSSISLGCKPRTIQLWFDAKVEFYEEKTQSLQSQLDEANRRVAHLLEMIQHHKTAKYEAMGGPVINADVELWGMLDQLENCND